jgi:5-methyltetrahydrofolate--homocysteine methyltransferase
METVLKGTKSLVRITPDGPTVLISKRAVAGRRKRPIDEAVNPIEVVKNEALAQIAAGADVVDVELDLADAEQEALLPRMITAVQQIVEAPLGIHVPSPTALAAALQVYQGQPLINGVTGDDESLRQILPLAAQYGAVIIGRCVDERGIPADDPYSRLEIARRIVKRAEAEGLPRENILIDCQTLPLEADHRAAAVTLETIRLVKTALGVNMTLDVSNISFELPNYAALQQSFLEMVIKEGVNAPLVNAAQARQSILAVDVLLGRDEGALRYIKYYHYRRSGIRSLVDWEMVG